MQYYQPIYFLVFLPIVMLLYSIVPKIHRWKVLLLASYIFFFSISRFLIVYLLISTVLIHYFGLWLNTIVNEKKQKMKECEKAQKKLVKQYYQKKQWRIVLLGILIHMGLLIVLKYSAFIETNMNILLNHFHITYQLPVHQFLVPIGISFYTLQAVSYMIDIYRGSLQADHNLGRLALFMSFFPIIMEGPICRYQDTAIPLYEGKSLEYQNTKFGFQRIAYGMMKKMIVADRLDILVKNIFTNYAQYDGILIALGAICYTCQLYMEFSGTMDMVIGSAEIFGVKLPENFKQPFFSRSISEFWTRWHITLGTWFKDYIYFSMSLSHPLRKLTAFGRKHLGNYYGPLMSGTIALFCVWFCNGIWHGEDWNYIFFGLYHFVLILLGNLIMPMAQKNPLRHSCVYHGFQMLRTACLVCVGELFFRAEGLKAGLEMFYKMMTDFHWNALSIDAVVSLGLDRHDLLIIVIVVLIVLMISVYKEKGVHIREWIAKRPIIMRWTLYYAIIFMIIIFGAYGYGYVPVDPIYAGF